MRFSLRTLLIVMLIAGPLGALGWHAWVDYRERLAEIEAQNATDSRWERAIMVSGQVSVSPTQCEIWDQQRYKITWESFPESTPSAP